MVDSHRLARRVAAVALRTFVALTAPLRDIGAVAAGAASPCVGDCNDDRQVTVDEVVLAVRVALQLAAVGTCSSADADADGQVTVDEIVRSVNALLLGCAASPTATTSAPLVLPTSTPTAVSTWPTPTASGRQGTPSPIRTGEVIPSPCFTNVASEVGLEYVQYSPPSPPPFYEQVYFSGGAAVGDFDGDGRDDLAVSRLDDPSLLLFRNRGDGGFSEVSLRAGLRVPEARFNGLAWGDIDNDGDLDLYATTLGPEQRRYFLFVNDGSGHFTEEAIARGAAVVTEEPHFGFSVAFGDYDRDGFVDIHVTEWRPRAYNRRNAPSHARLLRNEGASRPGYFRDVTVEAGVGLDAIPPLRADLGFGFSFASRFADLDEDGWPDLLIAADFGTSRLFWNRGDGTFLDGTVAAGVGTDENGMGSAVGDVDGDGLLDWFVSSVWDPLARCQGPEGCFWGTSGNRLYRNLGNRQFADVTDVWGVRNAGWAWGATFWDADNDGDLDLVVANGVHFPVLDVIGLGTLDDDYEHDPMRVWENMGTGMREVAAAWGLADDGQGRGVVVWDYDSDGDLDLFVANNAARPLLFRNDCGNRRSWLRVKAAGAGGSRVANGARVRVWRVGDAKPQVREIDGGSNFLGQNEMTAHFGLGGATSVDRVEVVWPRHGTASVWRNVPANTVLEAREP